MPLGAEKLYHAWKFWQETQRTQWTLGRFKSDTRWGNQLRERNWTPEQITEAIREGEQFPAPNNVNKINKAIRYEYDGRYAVRDEKTKEILQISKYSFDRPPVPGE